MVLFKKSCCVEKITKVAIEKNDAYLFIARLSREKGAELFVKL